MQQSSITQPTSRSIPPHLRSQADVTPEVVILGVSVILLPLLIALCNIVYKRHRTLQMRRRIATLEKLWQLNLPKKLH